MGTNLSLDRFQDQAIWEMSDESLVMPACWTCGTEVDGFMHTCPQCRQLAPLNDIKNSLQGGNQAATVGNVLSAMQLQSFRQMQETMSSGFSRIESVIRWGVVELQWSLSQQGDTLKAIDQTLKTPAETQANEWRLMADKLRERGVVDDAAEFYQKALNQNRLDFRIYIGLANTLIRQEKWDEANQILERSLPHAPRGSSSGDIITDYRSYSLRMQGRLHACMNDIRTAYEKLRAAIQFSPMYAEAQYDYATYAAGIGDSDACIASLQTAIDTDPLYFHLAQKQPLFRTCSAEVKRLLLKMRRDISESLEKRLEELVVTLGNLKEEYNTASSELTRYNRKWVYYRMPDDERIASENMLRLIHDEMDALQDKITTYLHQEVSLEYSEKRRLLLNLTSINPLANSSKNITKLCDFIERCKSTCDDRKLLLIVLGIGVVAIGGVIIMGLKFEG